jgi:hypothetical protein
MQTHHSQNWKTRVCLRCRHGGSLFEKCLRDTTICDGGCRFLHPTFCVFSSVYDLFGVTANLAVDCGRVYTWSTNPHLGLDASIHLYLCTRQSRPESTLHNSPNSGRISTLGNVDPDPDNGRSDSSPAARYRCVSGTFVRLPNSVISNVSRR